MKTKKGMDLLIALGGKKPPMGDEEDAKDHGDDEEAEGELPVEYETAWKEYQDHPSAQSFWDAVEACVSAGKDGKDDKGY
jgi:hypothetical protein